MSCYNGYIEIVRLLLRGNRTDLLKTTKAGLTALDVVRERGKSNIIKMVEEEVKRREQG